MKIQVAYDRKRRVFHVEDYGDFHTFANPAALAKWAWATYKVDFDPPKGYHFPTGMKQRAALADELQSLLRSLS